MPTYDYHCGECDHSFRRRLRISQRNDPGPCPECGSEGCRKVVTAPALQGMAAVQTAAGEAFTADLHKAEKAGKEIITPGSAAQRRIKDKASAAATKQVEKLGYRSVPEFKKKWGHDRKVRDREKQSQQIADYHKKHGSSGRQTVEQAFGK